MDTTFERDTRRLHRSLLATAAAALFALAGSPVFAQEAPALDATASAIAVDGDTLAPGQFEWTPQATASGPITIVVSLPAQMLHVYRGDVRIARSTISSGREGHETPPGVYEILEKDRMHHSNKYDNAPMPYMQRITWDGVALHSGRLPGYPASHGCVRLPDAFAAQLFEITEKGGRVIVADETNFGEAVLYPGARIPVDPWTGQERGEATATASLGTAPATQAIADAPAIAGN